jgi:hypothetical protein
MFLAIFYCDRIFGCYIHDQLEVPPNLKVTGLEINIYSEAVD